MNILGYNLILRKKKIPPKKQPVDATKKKIVALPPGPVAYPDVVSTYDISLKASKYKVIQPSVQLELIPVIRSLYKTNADMGSVLNDLIQLTNTGHHIKFDQSVDPALADKMRSHLKAKSKEWSSSVAGIHGLVNKLIAQIWVSGCLSGEWVPSRELDGIDRCALVNPENIEWRLDSRNTYHPWQKTHRLGRNLSIDGAIKLNTDTYSYLTILGDEDNPYTVPPLLTALGPIATQKDMVKNINHILKQLGLLGYLEVKVDKPAQQSNESESKYKTRLESLLKETKQNVIGGFIEGVVVGFEEDHEFEFHSTTKNLGGVSEVFNLNQNQVANGLKTSGSFIGLEQGGGEGQLGIVFTKMLSQLKNVQEVLSNFLVKGYTLELLMAGYEFKSLEVEFKKSTITDDLKNQQAREIKQRVLRSLWIDRIISSEQYADEMDYQKPHKVVEPPEPGSDASSQVKKEDREKDKDKSDRTSRDKKKSQPKRRDDKTQPR